MTYSTSSRATAAASASRSWGARCPRAHEHALDAHVERQRRGPRQRSADGLGDAPPVGVAAVQRGLDQRRVGHRAGDRLDPLRMPAGHDDSPHPSWRPPVAHDVQRELTQQRVQRLAEDRLGLALGLHRDAAGAAAMRIAVSLGRELPVDEMRSNERFTHTPSSRSAVSGPSTASVCTKHSIVAKPGWIIPAPLT